MLIDSMLKPLLLLLLGTTNGHQTNCDQRNIVTEQSCEKKLDFVIWFLRIFLDQFRIFSK